MRLNYPISGADNNKNRSNYDTSNIFGTNILWGSLYKKKNAGHAKFSKMAAIGYPEMLYFALKCR